MGWPALLIGGATAVGGTLEAIDLARWGIDKTDAFGFQEKNRRNQIGAAGLSALTGMDMPGARRSEENMASALDILTKKPLGQGSQLLDNLQLGELLSAREARELERMARMQDEAMGQSDFSKALQRFGGI